MCIYVYIVELHSEFTNLENTLPKESTILYRSGPRDDLSIFSSANKGSALRESTERIAQFIL